MNQRSDLWLASGLLALAAGIAANAIAGPLLLELVTYPFSESARNMTIGFEAVSLLVVAPLSTIGAVLVFRGDHVGYLVALPPSAYSVYVFSQFVVAPQYVTYSPIVLLHLGLFVLGGWLLVTASRRIRAEDLPPLDHRRRRIAVAVLIVLGGVTALKYVAGLPSILGGESIPAMYVDDPTVYWSIFLLDLGVVVPITVAVGRGLLGNRKWAHKALYGLVGWYVLAFGAVTALFAVLFLSGDPNGSAGSVLSLCVVLVLVVAVAGWIWLPVGSYRQTR